MKQRSPEWFAARVGRVTGSSAGAILGLSPHTTRADIMRRMVREHYGAEKEFTGNIATEYGQNHEDGAVFDFQLETGLTVSEVGFLTYEDWLGASPDGLTSDGGVLEVKVPFSLRKEKDPTFKTIREQPHYYAQVQIEILCAGVSFAWFYQWAPLGSRALAKVEKDQAWLDENLPRLRQFHAEYLDELKTPEQHLEPKRVEIDTAQASMMVREWDDLTNAIEQAQERKKALLAEMVTAAKERDALFSGRKLTKINKAGAVSYAKAIKAIAPDADLEPYRGKPTSYWGLT